MGGFLHTFWFTVWLILDFDLNLFTSSVSLEAIFIGIFLLISANKAEIKRDPHEKTDRQMTEIKRWQKEMMG